MIMVSITRKVQTQDTIIATLIASLFEENDEQEIPLAKEVHRKTAHRCACRTNQLAFSKALSVSFPDPDLKLYSELEAVVLGSLRGDGSSLSLS